VKNLAWLTNRHCHCQTLYLFSSSLDQK